MTVPLVPTSASLPPPSAKGWNWDREPNTDQDWAAGLMWSSPTVDASRTRVYLDAYLVQLPGGDHSVPGAPGVTFEIVAYFGVWRDCNGDGFMGDAASALLVYPGALNDPSICWPGGPHWDHRNGFVHELLWLSPEETGLPGEFYDPIAAVWADFALPNGPANPWKVVVPLGAALANPQSVLDAMGEGVPAKRAPDVKLRYVPQQEAAMPVDTIRTPFSSACFGVPCAGWRSGPLFAVPTLNAPNPAGTVAGFPGEWLTTYGWAQGYGVLEPPGDLRLYGAHECQDRELMWLCDDWRDDAVLPHHPYNVRDVDAIRVPNWIPWERDEDANGIGDAYWRTYDLVESLTDVDLDGASSLVEFRWGTIPVLLTTGAGGPSSRDYDNDGWLDGAEIAYWDANEERGRYEAAGLAGWAAPDPDADSDIDADQQPNHKDADADGDGLKDFDEATNHGTYPEYVDSDCDSGSVVCPGPLTRKFREDEHRHTAGGDGLRDAAEIAFWNAHPRGRGPLGDCDDDGIPNIRDMDSDRDIIPDGAEVGRAGGALDPCDADTDDDGLDDGVEHFGGRTDPSRADTDGDGMTDGWETWNGFDPSGKNESAEDPDADGLSNLEEFHAGTDPRRADTDRDDLSDAEELRGGTDPQRFDTDGDGMPDGWEIRHWFDPHVDDANKDADGDFADIYGDGMPDYVHTNVQEYLYGRPPGWQEDRDGVWTGGTHPHAADTDADGWNDGTEVYFGTPATVDSSPEMASDLDQDGLPNADEIASGTDASDVDSDDDGLCDGGRGRACRSALHAKGGAPGERDYGTNPRHADSDGDGLTDGEEAAQFDPARQGSTPDHDGDRVPAALDPDADEDGLSDGAEVHTHGTSPGSADTDGDTLSDSDEIYLHVGYDRAPDPLRLDTDGDGLDDRAELFEHGTSPSNADTDGDGANDTSEILRGSSPFLVDTDRDGMGDGWELMYGLDPTRDDAAEDADRDSGPLPGLSNIEEFLRGTRPDVADTDGDAIDDGWEVRVGLNPLADDQDADADGDGLPNLVEYLLGSDPNDVDTDDDGLSDAAEAGAHRAGLGVRGALLLLQWSPSDPTKYDTDEDGLDDKTELAFWATLGAYGWSTDYDGDDAQRLIMLRDAGNLRDPDADGDGFDDGQELLILGTSPHLTDTDDDGDDDRLEVMTLGTDPRDAESNRATAVTTSGTDTDGDGLSDGAETMVYGTDPTDPDSDDDLLNDGTERIAWGHDWQLNVDNDPITNNLLDGDADGDGLGDGLEFASSGLPRRDYYVTSPRLADTDGDGVRDGAEDSNGLVGENAARARSAQGGGLLGQARSLAPTIPLATPTARIQPDDVITGAYGVRLVPEWRIGLEDGGERGGGGSDSTPHASRSDTRSHPDRADTDHDGIRDGDEAEPGTAGTTWWNTPDSDGDGIHDRIERNLPDTDGDGHRDAIDADSDNDGIRDGEEDTNGDGVRQAHETDARDGDTDDDGLCDAAEASDPRVSPTNADSDADGLSDGREFQRKGGCVIGANAWTDSAALLGRTGRPTFQPYAGQGHVCLAGEANADAAAIADFDADGIIDGLEDINWDGVVDPSESDPCRSDSDGDKLLDGLEARVWGPMTLSQYQMARLSVHEVPLSKLSTSTRSADTDGDGIADGLDLNPNGRIPALFKWLPQQFWMLDAIDGWGEYTPEPWFRIDIETAGGSARLETPPLPEWTDANPSNPIDVAERLNDLLSVATATGELAEQFLLAGPAQLKLPEDISRYATGGPPGKVLAVNDIRFTLHMGDSDGGEKDASDVLDLNGERGAGTDFSYIVTWGQNPYEPSPTATADGSSDGGDGGIIDADDDARFTMAFKDTVEPAILSRARDVLAGDVPPVPKGQNFGFE